MTAVLSVEACAAAQAVDVYVKQGGSGEGTSWTDAFGKVQDAIDYAYSQGGGNVLVAAGTYTPTKTTGENGVLYSAFQIPSGVRVYGGFAGNETGTAASMIAGRGTGNETIFTGNLNGTAASYTWTASKNRFATIYYGSSYHVVVFTREVGKTPTATALDAEAVLDGVTITGGYANNGSIEENVGHTAYGGGVWMVGNAVLSNCEVYNCEASRDGGAIYMQGGTVDGCYVHDCQALGVNTTTGMGGGIAVKEQGLVSHTRVLNNVSRLGGGVSFSLTTSGSSKTGDAYAQMAMSASLVAQNVALVEAGGVYMNCGGVLNGVSVVCNKTYGTGSTIDGKVTGRSGGVYVRDYARLYNSVLWGNETSAKSANGLQYYSSRSKTSNEYKVDLFYLALSRSDYTDWSGSTKNSVFNLEDDNEGTSTSSVKYANFKTPCATAGHSSEATDTYVSTYDWTPRSTSAICYAGVQLKDLSDAPQLAAIDVDLAGQTYSPKCDLGAYVAEQQQIASGLTALYVDPEGNVSDASAALGQSWNNPLDNLADAVAYFKGTAGGTVYVKEGTLFTSSRQASGFIREHAIEMVSGVTVMGGYATELSGTDLSLHNPVAYPTVITGYVSGNYADNVAHLVSFDGVQDATLDGVQLKWGNATDFSTSAGVAQNYGAGIVLTDGCTGVTIRNVLVANCTASLGAAVYANDGGEASFLNCIFHNNEATTLSGGIVYVQGASTLSFDHCDLLRNVGYAMSVQSGNSSVTVDNSIFFANMKAACNDTKKAASDNALPAMTGSYASRVTGSHNFFDTATSFGTVDAGGTLVDLGNNNMTLSDDGTSYTYCKFLNPTKNAGVSLGSDVTTYGRATDFTPHNMNPATNAADATHLAYTDMIGVTRNYGGRPDAGALENCTTQPAYGTAYYVRDYRNADGTVDTSKNLESGYDGMSWQSAINGNVEYASSTTSKTVYTLNASATFAEGTEYKLRANCNNALKYIYWDDANSCFNSSTNYDDGDVFTIEAKTVTLTTTVSTKTEVSVTTTTQSGGGPDGPNGENNNSTSTTTTQDPTYETSTSTQDVTYYVIYDVTQEKYLYATDTGETGKAVQIKSGIEKDCYWDIKTTNKTICPVTIKSDPVTADPTTTTKTETSQSQGQGRPGGGQQTTTTTVTTTTVTVTTTTESATVSSNGWNLYGGSGFLGLYRNTDNNTKSWMYCTQTSSTKTTTESINGLQYAVNTSFASGNAEKPTVHVGEGQYEYAPQVKEKTYPTDFTHYFVYEMKEGVDVLGGYPATGNPDENERSPKEHVSYLQTKVGASPVDNTSILGQANVGRVLYQDAAFTTETKWDGFTIRRGYLFQCMKVNIVGNIAHIVRNDDHKYVAEGFQVGEMGGAGAILRAGGVLENCCITQNVQYFNSSDYSSGQMIDGNSSEYGYTNGGFHIGGAGIYNDGGTVKNCEIIGNQLYSDRASDQADWAYGAGLFMGSGTVYNTVISGNDIRSNCAENTLNGQNNDVHSGAGIFIFGGSFYNNTVVNNQTTTNAGHTTSSLPDNQNVYSPGVFILGTGAVTLYNTIIADNKSYLYSDSYTTADHRESIKGHESEIYTAGHLIYDYPIVSVGNAWALVPGLIKAFYCCVGEASTYYRAGNSGADASTGDAYGEQVAYNQSRNTELCNNNLLATDPLLVDQDDDNYRETSASPCINAALEQIPDVTLPEYDAEYTDRIKDCHLDIGAYEYDGAKDITPELNAEGGTATYYVSWDGFGTTQAYNAANAACHQKLQKVLDAAGRYKYNNISTRVIVKVAGVDATADGFSEANCSEKYYPLRTTDETDDNVRAWSIMVPRGVEVWGGYYVDDVTADEAAERFSDDERSILYHPTYFLGQYTSSSDKSTIHAYHTVTFTDVVYDAEGNATTDTLSKAGVTDRAVLDGLFLVGGQADGQYGNEYGGAAVVTDFAHVRNCVVKDNEATYGGGLALEKRGLVSGTLVKENTAEEGGGIYIKENAEGDETGLGTDAANMAHVYTTTVVNNTATTLGGGIWFSNDNPNVRVNSTVVWKNICADQANVAGNTNPDLDNNSTISTFQWYPFAYSAVESRRVSGTSNISVDMNNQNGVRFGIDSQTSASTYCSSATLDADNHTGDVTEPTIANSLNNITYFGLTNFSALCRTGMPWSEYEALVTSDGLTHQDMNKWCRDIVPSGTDSRQYVDIGCRAFPSSPLLDTNYPFLRLFVAQTEDVDMDAYNSIMSATIDQTDDNYVYKLLGSSFAYPFQNLDDALNYITTLRKSDKWQDKANNWPFEICMARGDYYPQRDMQGNYGYSLSNTFLIPEGVTLTGGFDCNDIYGQKYTPHKTEACGTDLSSNVDERTDASVTVNGQEILQQELSDMLADRPQEDINMNNILEPWEFTNQTTLSGNSVNHGRGVYHTVSVIPYAPGVGQLPAATYTNTEMDWAEPKSMSDDQKAYWAYHSRYVGQPVVIDGVKVADGYAASYVAYSLNDYSIYDYYHGGGLHATGNWYCDNKDGEPNKDDVYYSIKTNSVAYRDIPLYIRNCQFVGNTAGYGGALNTNVSTYVYTSYFAQNEAIRENEKVTWEILDEGTKDAAGNVKNVGDVVQFDNSYPGDGGAVYYNKTLEVYNTIFANNEAKDETQSEGLDYGLFPTLKNQSQTRKVYSGAGGALCGGVRSHLMMMNCDVVRNKALVYPAVFTMNPNGAAALADGATEEDYNQIVNTLFWGNEATEAANSTNDFARSLVVNYGPSTRTATTTYVPDISTDNTTHPQPTTQSELDAATYGETMWFCAYDKNQGKSPEYSKDYRDAAYSKSAYIGQTVLENNNIFLSTSNDAIDGPNFGKPTSEAGYNGHNENADWSRSRVNNLTDNGSCHIAQTDAGWAAEDDSQNSGAYYTQYENRASLSRIDLFADQYMVSTAGETDQILTRVAHDPFEGVSEARIDIGVYERPKTSLRISGNDVDIIWVSATENTDNGEPNGISWLQPTSDLQRAIETLLSSRNNRRKEIRLIEGEYAPTYTYSKDGETYQTFYINTEALQASAKFPDGSESTANYGINSLTIKGGYSKDVPYEEGNPKSYNSELYPTVLRMPMRQTTDGKRWNYLFYVDDATQRYGLQQSDADKEAATGYGAFVLPTSGVQDASFYTATDITTIPIQFDGLTFVNNQALPGVQGSALYYADQQYSFTTGGQQYTKQAVAPASVWVTDASSSLESKYVDGFAQTVGTYNYSVKSDPAKLILTKCTVMNSGNTADAADSNASAMYVGQYGGDALIYNSVFHSNLGKPIVANDAKTVNNTIALNQGQWTLTGTSYINNSILWKNCPDDEGGYGNQFALNGWTSDEASGNIFHNNAYTCYVSGNVDVTTGRDDEMSAQNYNTHLSDNNDDQEYGPVFQDPENTEVESRSFLLRPSIRIINKGDQTLYNDSVCDLAWIATTGIDYDNGQRVYSDNIEKGAVEYQNSFDHRVYYVKPGEASSGDGLSWTDAMNSLQDAIDQAALYCLTNLPEKDADGNIVDPNEAYVLVKGGSVNDGVTLKKGVNVYGTVSSSAVVPCDDSGSKPAYYDGSNTTYDDFKSEVEAIVNDRPGLVALHTTPTTVPSVSTPTGTVFETERPTKLDGFIISSATTDADGNTVAGVTSQPVLSIKPANVDGDVPAVCISNVVVADNDASASAVNMADIDNALIYEVLFRDNAVKDNQYVLHLGSRAYGVNLTVEGQTYSASVTNTMPQGASCLTDNASTDHIWYSIYNYKDYARDEQTLSQHNYAFSEPNLNYQLTEKSQNIDQCPAVNPMELEANLSATPSTRNLVQFINYPTDRDLLGNPRVLNTASGKAGSLSSNPSAFVVLDRGAFETWKVGDDETRMTVFSGSSAELSGTPTASNNYYPHDGSVVYLMEGSNLVSEAHALTPGFLLVKKGASLYGQQQTVNVAYVAVERDVPQDGAIMALPYDMVYSRSAENQSDISHGPATFAYADNGVLTLTADNQTTTRTYNGEARAEARYQFMNQNSGCWNAALSQGTVTEANTGVFFDASNTETVTYRFTAKGETMADYIYQEEVDAESKPVTLVARNNEPTDGFGKLTAEEDMGWNCFGVPYLVSEYKPYAQHDDNDIVADGAYQMHLPKQLWLYYDGQQTPDGLLNVASGNNWTKADTVINYAGFYAVNSWEATAAKWHMADDATPALWVGEGMFAQTAKYSDETLRFYVPLYNGAEGKLEASTYRLMTRLYVETIEEKADDEARQSDLDGMVFDLVGRRVQQPSQHGIYIVNGKRVWL